MAVSGFLIEFRNYQLVYIADFSNPAYIITPN